jgi:hypothetical protein
MTDTRPATRDERWTAVRRVALRTAGLTALLLATSAHVGTLDTFFAGKAGGYDVQVTVRPPGVVPGRAQIIVRVAGEGVRRVTTQAAQWNVGTQGAPQPDEAKPVPGSPGLYSSDLWLMTAGSYAVNVGVEGTAGSGVAVVPVASLATQRLGMDRNLGIVLIGLGAFLVVGLLSIVGAAARESTLPPGEAMTPRVRWRARGVMVVAAVVFGLALNGGWSWWNSVDASYARGMYRPFTATPAVRSEGAARIVRLRLEDSAFATRTPLIPDHGKMMHLFLVREGTMDAFAHLHPTRLDALTFEAPLGDLTGGRFRYFADVVHESGLSQTIVGTIDVPAPTAPAPFGDPDDAVLVPQAGARSPVAAGDTAILSDGATVVWHRPPALRPKDDAPLRFTVRESDGREAQLEPYMGMPAHAMVMRDDASVFMHLHAMGSISPVAQQVLIAIDRGDTLPSPIGRRAPRPVLRADSAMAAHQGMMVAGGELTFPFAFPKAGRYRIWVQLRHGGAVRTAAFDATVADGGR